MASIICRNLSCRMLQRITCRAGLQLKVFQHPVAAISPTGHLQNSLTFNKRTFSCNEAEGIIHDNSVVTSKDMRKILKAYVGTSEFFKEQKDNSTANVTQIVSQDQLETRSVNDSVKVALIPLGDDPFRREKYLTFYKTVRIGMLLEDMDTLAGLVGYKYYKGPSNYEGKAPFALVTASVDKFDVKENNIASDRNIWMTGFVSYAGKTSLEIKIHLDQDNEDSRKRIADATFVMVARDPVKQKGAFVNTLVPQTPEEQEIFNQSAQYRKAKKLNEQKSLFKTAPSAEERVIIHDLFLTTLDETKSTFHNRVKPANTVWMEQTRLKNLIICHPQIVFTEKNYLQTRVHAEVVDPKTGHIDTTNVFHYHFMSKREFPQIIPMSYGEYMLYLEGRRHAQSYLKKEEFNDENP